MISVSYINENQTGFLITFLQELQTVLFSIMKIMQMELFLWMNIYAIPIPRNCLYRALPLEKFWFNSQLIHIVHRRYTTELRKIDIQYLNFVFFKLLNIKSTTLYLETAFKSKKNKQNHYEGILWSYCSVN